MKLALAKIDEKISAALCELGVVKLRQCRS